jgi:hemolysin activation/secretion protein
VSLRRWLPGPSLGVIPLLCLVPASGVAQTPSAAPADNAPGTPSSSAAATGPAPHFDILEFVVDGNTVLSETDIETAVYPFLGEGRTAADVDQARDALERAYAQHGFQTVQVEIPPQGVENAIIHLGVVENPVGRLRVVNAKYHTPSSIEANAPSLAEGRVPNTHELQDDIVALNQQPDLRVTPRLVAGKTPGTVDVELDVEDHPPLHGSLEINNAHNQNTTPLRLIGSVSYNNLWQLGHSINLSYQVAPENPSDARVFSGSYLAPIARTPVSLLLYGVKSDSNVAALAGTNVIGRGGIVGGRIITTLPGSETFYQSVTAGVDRKDLTQNVITAGSPSNAPVLYYPLTLAYAATLQESDTVTQADASLNVALPGLGSNSEKFDQQRFQARPDYLYFKADLSRTQPLPADLVAYGKIDGQITSDSLLSSEQYSMGGATTVRGYLEAERLGDYGAHATTELRSPSFAELVSPRIDEWRVFTFLDAATVLLRQPLPQEKASFRVASVGIGTRIKAFDTLNGDADLAFPLYDGAVTKAGAPVVDFRVWSEF